jgi:hypothetical protein
MLCIKIILSKQIRGTRARRRDEIRKQNQDDLLVTAEALWVWVDSSWNCIPEHRPLGSIQRVRLKAYETSSLYRHEMNQQQRIEPRSVDEMPD